MSLLAVVGYIKSDFISYNHKIDTITSHGINAAREQSGSNSQII